MTGGIAVTPFTVALLVNPQENGLVDQAGWVAGALGPAVAFLLFFLQNRTTRHEQAPARAANEAGPITPRVGPAALSPVETVPTTARMWNRTHERRTLRWRLLDGSGGVVVVSGEPGIGKSRLMSTVLSDLRKRRWSLAPPHIISYEAAPDRRLFLRAVVDDMERLSGVQPVAWEKYEPHAAAPDQFRAALEALGKRRLVIVIESAEHLLDASTGEIADDELNEAFETLATTTDHRTYVILVTRTAPRVSERHVWPTMVTSFEVGALPVKDFTRYLRELDKATGHDLARPLAAYHKQLRGNPRLAELAHAIFTSQSFDHHRLASIVLGTGVNGLSRALIDELVKGLGLVARRVLETLDAFGTPIDSAGVCAVLEEKHPEGLVKDMLATLAEKGVVRTTPDGRYYLLPSEADWLGHGTRRERLTDAQRSELLYESAKQLLQRQVRPASSIEDLRVDFAGLQALLRTGVMVNHIYDEIEDLSAELRPWNSGFLLIDQRKALRGRLGDPKSVQKNENELGHLYAAQGRLTESIEAYSNAMRHAEERADVLNRIRIELNLAGAYWWYGDVKEACAKYSAARKNCDESIRRDPNRYSVLRAVRLGALDGMADCHRHHGRYDEALELARLAMDEPEHPAYPDTEEGWDAAARCVGIALKLARWHIELGEDHEVDVLVAQARAEIERQEDRPRLAGRERDDLRAFYSAGVAGSHLLQGRFHEASMMANLAVRDALKFGDPATLLLARTSLCYAYLFGDDADDAAATRQIDSAARYRRPGGPLIVPALQALVAPGGDDARTRFEQIFKETDKRIERDEDDITAWNYRGFAMCGLGHRFGVEEARETFGTAREKTLRPAPNRVGLIVPMLELLDRRSTAPGRLQSVIRDLRTAGARPADA
ncbi:tetratricopeptide repeat protein [Nonomuraea sp. NPDC049504]|uniref:tetratricopeptide repeat protein n=1 Tax=Nonomuraea sp. NPDC049504 TaxID=3154729 RepID=UPI00341860A8